MRCKHCKKSIEIKLSNWWHTLDGSITPSIYCNGFALKKAEPDIFHHYYTQIHIK